MLVSALLRPGKSFSRVCMTCLHLQSNRHNVHVAQGPGQGSHLAHSFLLCRSVVLIAATYVSASGNWAVSEKIKLQVRPGSRMGYAGYVPAKYASKLTPEQAALKAVANEASYELMAKVVRNVVSSLRSFLTGLLAATHDVRTCRSMFRHVHACSMRSIFLICCRPVPGCEPLGREVPPAAAQQRQNLGSAHKGARLPALQNALARVLWRSCAGSTAEQMTCCSYHKPRSCLRQVLNALATMLALGWVVDEHAVRNSHQIPTCLTLLGMTGAGRAGGDAGAGLGGRPC